MQKAELTTRQRQIFNFVRDRIYGGVPPSVREIGAEFGINSPNGVICHLKALRKKGYIEWDEHQARTIRLVDVPTMSDAVSLLGTIRDRRGADEGVMVMVDEFVEQAMK